MFGAMEGTSLNVKVRSFSDLGSAIYDRISSDQNMKSGEWIVNKFGGTSVESAKAMKKVCDIVIKSLEDCTSRVAVVVSAIGGNPKVTDLLLQAVDLAATSGFESARGIVDGLCEKHIEYIKKLCIPWNEAETIIKDMKADIENIQHVLKVVSLFKHHDQVMKDLVSGYGEVWSGQVLCASLNARGASFSFINARNNILIVDDTPDTGVVVDWEASNDRLRDALSNLGNNTHLVITGFVACTKEGLATTLKRDGSDYSASIFGKLLKAKAINIWTDVDGIMSADPRLVQESRVLEHVSYSEALELSYFGAKVIHQKAMLPAALAGIPIYVKNTFNPLAPGTCIFYSRTATEDRPGCVCGIGIVRDVALINIEGTGMIGVPGISERLFRSLHVMSINVIFVSQASSELSITIAIRADLVDAAQACISNAFSMELSIGSISKVTKIQSCCIVTIVGDSMMHERNVSGRFFSALGKASINVIAIAQGSNERNVSCVVSTKDSAKALQVVHNALIVPTNRFNIGVYGVDSPVGNALMKMINDRCSALNQRYNSNLRVHAIVDARDDGEFIADGEHGEQLKLKLKIQVNEEKEEENLKNKVESKEQDCHCHANGEIGESKLGPKGQQPTTEMNYHQLLHSLHSVIIDCSTGEDVPGQTSRLHKKWLEAKMSVISNNAFAISGMLHSYNSSLCKHFKSCDGVKYLYENILPVNIPILSTLRHLQAIGDSITRIEFSFSSSLNYVMSLVNPVKGKSSNPSLQQMTLMKAVLFVAKIQRWKNTTNLPGDDIRMWLLILGRSLGLELENNIVKVETPIPSCVYEKALQANVELSQSSAQDRNESVNSRESNPSNMDYDDAILAANVVMARRVEAAQAKRKVLRHVAGIDVPSCSAWANLCEVDLCDDFASVNSSICCIRIEVQGKETPVVLKGPAMMPKDTANVIFSEIANLAQELGVLHCDDDNGLLRTMGNNNLL